MNERSKKAVLYAYGFDRIGFSSPRSAIEEDDFIIELINFMGGETLAQADGILIPSGIFESFENYQDHHWTTRTKVKFDRNYMAQREKELFNAIEKGAWVCFLLGKIWNGRKREWLETDLAKKLLNCFFAEVHDHDPNPHIQIKSDEFRAYLDHYGISQTAFAAPTGDLLPQNWTVGNNRLG